MKCWLPWYEDAQEEIFSLHDGQNSIALKVVVITEAICYWMKGSIVSITSLSVRLSSRIIRE